MSFKNALVSASVLPGGIILGFYLIYMVLEARADGTEILWPLITSPACALVISFVITAKKRIQQKYTFDNLYYNILACGFFIISGLFFMRRSLDIAFYFGFAGKGISYISSVTYAGYTSATTRKRHFDVGVLHLYLFVGLTASSVLIWYSSGEDAEFRCGLILIGLSILIIGILVTNQILNYCNLNNYRISNDPLWNYYNARNWLYKNRPEILAIHQRIDNRFRQPTFAIVKTQESITIFFIILVQIVNFMMFCNVTLSLGFMVSKYNFQTGGYTYLVLAATGGVAFSLILLSFLSPKVIYTIFGIVKCALLVCILLFFENSSTLGSNIIYYLCYFFCTGVIYSIPNTLLLEVTNPRNCEIVLSTGYFIQTIVLHIIVFFSRNNFGFMPDLESFIRALYISYIVLAAFATLAVQIFCPIGNSLIEIRNYLIGIRKNKTIVSFR